MISFHSNISGRTWRFFPESGGRSDWKDSTVPWVVRCRAHIPTEYSKRFEAVLCHHGWGPGYFPGWHSTPPQSISWSTSSALKSGWWRTLCIRSFSSVALVQCLRTCSCRMRSLVEKTSDASTSSGDRSFAAIASCIVLAGTATGGCTEISCNRCSMSAAFMQEERCFKSVASIWASSSISISVRGPWSAKSRSSMSSSKSICRSASCPLSSTGSRHSAGRISASARDIYHKIWASCMISYMISCIVWYHVWYHTNFDNIITEIIYDIIHDII